MSDFFNSTGDNSIEKKVCPQCAWENDPSSKFCPHCGTSLEKRTVEAEEVPVTPWQEKNSNPYYSSGSTNNAGYNTTNTGSYYYNQNETGKEPVKSGLPIASMVCGIISLLCCYLTIPLTIAALVTGIISLNKKYSNKGMAIAGIVTGSVAVLIYGVIFILLIIFGTADSSYY